MKYRKYPIIVINVLLLTFIIKTYFFDPASDTNGLFSLFLLSIMIFYNIYFIILNYMMFQRNKHYEEILFYLFLLTPIAILFYYF